MQNIKQYEKIQFIKGLETVPEEDTDVYSEDFIFGLTENDQISPAEEGFMVGYMSA